MNVLWFTWKDARHPWAGGAEVVGTELRKRLAQDGHQVKVLTSSVAGAPDRETVDGVEIIRRGSQCSVYWHAYRYYRKNLVGWADVIIDEVNTLPFFCRWFAREPVVMLFHQLCREVWLYQMSFPIKYFGYLLEPLYLRCLRRGPTIAMSNSTKRDLQRCGYNGDQIYVISEGILLKPIDDLSSVRKNSEPTLLSFGSVRPMKRSCSAFASISPNRLHCRNATGSRSVHLPSRASMPTTTRPSVRMAASDSVMGGTAPCWRRSNCRRGHG